MGNKSDICKTAGKTIIQVFLNVKNKESGNFRQQVTTDNVGKANTGYLA